MADDPAALAGDGSTGDAAQIIELERGGWEALATGGDAAGRFYGDVLASETLMLLPGGMALYDRDQILDAMQGAPWDGFDLADERVQRLCADCAVLTYTATASRGDQRYRALISSTYVLERGRWRLAMHQQTPF